MSLRLPSAYSEYLSKSSIKENWLVQLGYDDFPGTASDFVGLSFYDTYVGSNFYYGCVTGDIKLRTSFDLASSTCSSGNITITIANFKYGTEDFSTQLLSGSNDFINRAVRIYSQLGDDVDLTDCLQIYEGRLIDVSQTDNTITLKIVEKRPWDLIKIPNTKTTTSKRYFPVAYGAFDNSTASIWGSTDFCTNKALFPVPVDSFGVRDVHALLPHSSSVSDGKLFYYESALDKFVPIYDTDYFQTSIAYDGGYASRNRSSLKRAVKYRPDNEGSGNEWTDPEKAFDSSTSGSDYATYSRDLSTTNSDSKEENDFLILNVPNIDHTCNNFKQRINFSMTFGATGTPHANSFVKIIDNTYDAEENIYVSQTPGSGGNAAQQWSPLQEYTENGQLPSQINFELVTKCVTVYGYSATVEGDGYVWDVECQSEHEVANSQKGQEGKHIDLLYSGADGLDNSFSGGSGSADTGLEAHRDLLARFTGFDAADADIYNWDTSDSTFDYSSNINSLNIESARISTPWSIRWWALEPKEIKDILERIQYEFCFIFKWRADGSGSYWYVKNSYSSGDVAATLDYYDIKNLSISTTPFSELMTKMEVSYEKHPADNRFLNSVTSVDDTNDVREKWYGSQATKENIEQVDLEMNVNKPGNANPGGGNPNDGLSDYYMNIFGTVKTIISCDVVNHTKGYALETGDIIQFHNSFMPTKLFGSSWSGVYFMITSLSRGRGSVSITCRQVS